MKCLALTAMAFVYSISANADTDNTLTFANMSGEVGGQVVLTVGMNNTASITGFQFDLYLPEGVTIAKDSYGDEKIELLTTRTSLSRHSISWNVQEDGAMRVACTSMNNRVFTGTTGDVATITLNIADNVERGDYDIIIKKIELTTPTLVQYKTAQLQTTLSVSGWACSHVHGDVNGDRQVTIEDLTELVDILMKKP